MKNTLLVQTILAFTPEERQEISLFLQEGYFNRGKHAKQIGRLFNLLTLKIDEGKVDMLDKALLFAEFFQKKQVSSGYFDNLMTELLGLLRQFMACHWIKREAILDAVSADFYQQRGLEARAAQALHRMHVRLQTAPEMDPFRQVLELWGALERVAMESRHNQRQGDLNLPAGFSALAVAFSSQLLHLTTLMYQQQRYVGQPDRQWNSFIESFGILIQQENYFGQPALEFMQQVITLICNPSESPRADLEFIIGRFQQFEAVFPAGMLKNLAACARNFCTVHYRTDPQGMAGVMLALYQEHLQKGWLYENGMLHPSYLINMVTMGMRAGKGHWIKEMLQAHRGLILNDEGETIWQYCLANYHFYTGNLLEANKFVLVYKPKDFEIEKVIRIFNVKTAFELNPKGDHLQSQLQAFSMSLSRNKARLAMEKLVPARRFIAAVRKMTQTLEAKPPDASLLKSIQLLFLKLADASYSIAERAWLQEKIRNLTNSK